MPGPLASPLKALAIAVERGVTLVTLGSEYENLSDTELDDLKTALQAAASSANPPLMALDLSKLRFFNSAFIEAMFRCWSQLNTRPGARFALCGLTDYCREVVEVTHLDQLWGVFGTRDEAVRSLSDA